MFNLFSNHEIYPNNLAEEGIRENTIYHGVSKYLMTGLIAFTSPYYGVIAERCKLVDVHRVNYLTACQEDVFFCSLLDDMIILSEGRTSIWVWWTKIFESCGSVGRISKSLVSATDLIHSLKEFILQDRRNNDMLSGEYLEVPVFCKRIVFH